MRRCYFSLEHFADCAQNAMLHHGVGVIKRSKLLALLWLMGITGSIRLNVVVLWKP